jgi:hypothetical protein
VYALGFSNGGMILQTALCKSRYLRATLTGVALVNTVLRKAYLDEECADTPAATANGSSSQQQQQRKVPLVVIHGMQDTLFPFYQGSSSATGDVLLSTCELTTCTLVTALAVQDCCWPLLVTLLLSRSHYFATLLRCPFLQPPMQWRWLMVGRPSTAAQAARARPLLCC